MSKFKENLIADNSSIKENRARIIINATENELTNHINKIKNEINRKEMELEQLNDVAPENTFSLKPGGEGFDPQKWVEGNVRIEQDLYSLRIKLDIAQKIYKVWFKEDK